MRLRIKYRRPSVGDAIEFYSANVRLREESIATFGAPSHWPGEPRPDGPPRGTGAFAPPSAAERIAHRLYRSDEGRALAYDRKADRLRPWNRDDFVAALRRQSWARFVHVVRTTNSDWKGNVVVADEDIEASVRGIASAASSVPERRPWDPPDVALRSMHTAIGIREQRKAKNRRP